MHIAIGTSFGVMLINNINAARHHYKSNNLDMNIFKKIVPFLIIGVAISIALSSYLSSDILQSIFIIIIFYIMVKFLIRLRKCNNIN
jgi:uncharacterized membrane protein YfcA